MDGRGKDVVRRLPEVDVVVGMDVLAGEACDHLVRVHVRRGARARLEDVDRKLVVELAGGHAVGGGGDALRLVRVEQAELGVDARGGGLDPPEPTCDGVGIGSPETGKFSTAFWVSPPHSSRSVSAFATKPSVSALNRVDPASLERAVTQGAAHQLVQLDRAGPAEITAPVTLVGVQASPGNRQHVPELPAGQAFDD